MYLSEVDADSLFHAHIIQPGSRITVHCFRSFTFVSRPLGTKYDHVCLDQIVFGYNSAECNKSAVNPVTFCNMSRNFNPKITLNKFNFLDNSSFNVARK